MVLHGGWKSLHVRDCLRLQGFRGVTGQRKPPAKTKTITLEDTELHLKLFQTAVLLEAASGATVAKHFSFTQRSPDVAYMFGYKQAKKRADNI